MDPSHKLGRLGLLHVLACLVFATPAGRVRTPKRWWFARGQRGAVHALGRWTASRGKGRS